MPAAVADRLAEYARVWATRGVRAWGEGWWTMPLAVGDQVGRIIGAPPARRSCTRTSPSPRRSSLSCFSPVVAGTQPRRLRGRELPLGALPLPGPAGARGRGLPGRRGDRRGDRRAHAARADLARALPLGRDPGRRRDHRARARGRRPRRARLLPVGRRSSRSTSSALGVDFAVGGSVKWLCGGPGNGWLYVRPDLIEQLAPTLVGWQAHAAPFAFEPELRYADGVARFLTGTPERARPSTPRRRATT